MIRAVIFDFNGVLVDDEHVHFELFREVLGRGRGGDHRREHYHERYLGSTTGLLRGGAGRRRAGGRPRRSTS